MNKIISWKSITKKGNIHTEKYTGENKRPTLGLYIEHFPKKDSPLTFILLIHPRLTMSFPEINMKISITHHHRYEIEIDHLPFIPKGDKVPNSVTIELLPIVKHSIEEAIKGFDEFKIKYPLLKNINYIASDEDILQILYKSSITQEPELN